VAPRVATAGQALSSNRKPARQPADIEPEAEPLVAARTDSGTSQGSRTVQTTAPASIDPAPAAITAVSEKVTESATVTTEAVVTGAEPTEAAPSVLPRLVTGILASFGLGSPGTDAPAAPPAASLLMTLVALGSRRDLEQRAPVQNATASVTPVAAAAPFAAAAVTAPATTRVGWLTGANSLNNTVTRFGIAGTDIGVMWDNGYTGDNPATAIVEQRQVLLAFGDTFSKPGMVVGWRNNVLFRSADNVLSNGLYVPNGIIHDPGAFSGSPMSNPNYSREIIGKYGYAVGSEVTIIPTAAISVQGAGASGGTRQYVNFMSVRSWDSPGRWTTNYSGIIWSDDNGQNWTVVPSSSIRSAAAGRSTRPFISGNQNFQQGAYVKPPVGSADSTAGWVYSYGTPAGRTGTVFLSRVNEKQLLDQTKYQYWNGSAWVTNSPSAAKPVLPGTTTTSFFGLIKKTTYPTVSEMSVQYNPYLKKYVMLYGDQNNNVVMRTSSTPQGTWSAPKTLVTSAQYPGLYAPMIHPWSGTPLLKKTDGKAEDPQMLYWNLSQWNEYNVALMRTDLTLV
jgi:D-arabinan endo alpha-(1,5)-arabinofuranosidase